jgi:hypothetical protein
MWGLTLQFWQSVVVWANVVALVGGVLTGAALFVSAWVSSNIADVVQQDADRRIAEARTSGDEARADAAKANQRASEAAERAASLEKETAQANERAAELKLALEKEIAARQPRQIEKQRLPALREALTKIPNKGEITITWKLFDEEAERFGKQLLEVIREIRVQRKGSARPIWLRHSRPVDFGKRLEKIRNRTVMGGRVTSSVK